jgi:hypothetical protein
MFQMLGVFAEFERAMIVQRVRGGERTPLPHLNAMLLPPTGQPRMVSRISSTDGALPCCQGLQWNRAADREGRRWCRSGGQSDDWITRPKMNPCRQFRFEANGL